MLSAQDLELMDLLGYLYLRHGQPAKAAALIAARIALVPGQPRVLLALALAYVRAGDGSRALQALEQVARAGAIDPHYHLLRVQALQLQGLAEKAAAAMQAYLRAISPPAAVPEPQDPRHGLRTPLAT